MKKLMIFLVFSSCFLEFSNAQQTQSDDFGSQMEIQKTDTLLVDKMMFEMVKELKLSDIQKAICCGRSDQISRGKKHADPF